jgi:hypothetical protein
MVKKNYFLIFNFILNFYIEYKEFLDLVEISAVHDSINCLKILYDIFKDELDDEDIIEYLKNVSKKYGSDSVIKFLDERNVGEFDMDKFNDRSIVKILFYFTYFFYIIYLLLF